MRLEEKLSSDLTIALKNKNTVAVSTLRLLLTAIQYEKLNARKDALCDSDIMAVIEKQIKQRNDSIEQYQRGGRADLCEKEQAELGILSAYLPKQLTDEELQGLVKRIIIDVNAQGKKDMGRVIKAVRDASSGAADGKRISTIVGNLLIG